MTDFYVHEGRLHSCPCCGFPTLGERGVYDICVVCWWEDDNAEITAYTLSEWAAGGPNGKYSIEMARGNFLDHGHMYDESKGISVVESPSTKRLALLDYVASVLNQEQVFEDAQFRKLLKCYNKSDSSLFQRLLEFLHIKR